MIAEVRAHVATALDGLDVAVHQSPPSNPVAPYVVLNAGSPYVTVTEAWGSSEVNLELHLAVSATSPAAATNMDALIDAVLAALKPARVRAGQVPRPEIPSDQPAVLTVDIPASTVWEDD